MPHQITRHMMAEHGIRHLPVKEGTKLVGVVSDRDIKQTLDPELGLPPKEALCVRDVSVREAYLVDLDERLDNVLMELADRHIDCALVVRDDRLAGIFTTTDACRVFGEYLRSLFSPGTGDDAA